MVPASKAPLFMLGPARGGTTYLSRVLNDWFDYGMGPEGQFVEQFARQLSRYGDLARDENIDRLASDVCRCEMLRIARDEYPAHARFNVTPELLVDCLHDRTYASVVRGVFTLVAQFQGKTRVGNKNPFYWRCLPLLESLFPEEARYVFVIRDGRDVALSLRNRPWGENTAYGAARSWVACMDAIERFARQTDPARWHAIRYETFLDDPDTEVGRLAGFLEMQDGDFDLDGLVASIKSNPKRSNHGKWRVEMSVEDQRVFEAIAANQLRNYEYELAHCDPHVKPHEHVYFAAEEFVRRAKLTLRGALRR